MDLQYFIYILGLLSLFFPYFLGVPYFTFTRFVLFALLFIELLQHVVLLCCIMLVIGKPTHKKGRLTMRLGLRFYSQEFILTIYKRKCQHVCLFSATNIRRLRTHLLKDCNYTRHFNDSLHLPQCVCECLPESSILGCGPARYNLGDED